MSSANQSPPVGAEHPTPAPGSAPQSAPQVAHAGRVRSKREPDSWKILVVDDDESLARVIHRILSVKGYRVLVANTGEAALRLIDEEKPDIILLDWMLPGLNGLEVCNRIKENPDTRGTMILLVTARTSLDQRVEGFDAGADDFIPKPFNQMELLARIRSALRIKELTDNLAERNRQLLTSHNELVRQEKMATIGLLASGIAHEFNNIIAGISGFAQIAKKDPRYVGRFLEVALTQTARAMELTGSLSTYNRRIDETSGCDAAEIIRNALCLVKKVVQESSISVTTSLEQVPPASIAPGQLQEVVLNMLVNAIQAIGTNGSVHVRLYTTGGVGGVNIDIEDSGCGISPQNIERIFDPFFTTKGALGGGSQGGTGLGLSVCSNIVQSRGGRIAVVSTVGKGTKFTVSLPRHAAEKPTSDMVPVGVEESKAAEPAVCSV